MLSLVTLEFRGCSEAFRPAVNAEEVSGGWSALELPRDSKNPLYLPSGSPLAPWKEESGEDSGGALRPCRVSLCSQTPQIGCQLPASHREY